MKLSIIIPVYNEKSTIVEVIRRCLAVSLPGGIDREIVVVDDGSRDGTPEEMQAFSQNPTVRTFFLPRNQGKTEAVRHGITQSSGDVILIQDADLEYSPEHYPELLKPILSGQAEVVYGSRFLGEIKNMAFINWFANKVSVLTINALFHAKLSDFHTCYKVFKGEILRAMPITSRKFVFDTEITVRLLQQGYKIYEVPIHYVARSRKQGKKITWGGALEAYFFLLSWVIFRKLKKTA